MNVPHVSTEATSNQFTVGLVALKFPIDENGPVAATTATVQFDEELPIHSSTTNARVFKAAEKVFRDMHHFANDSVGIRESFLSGETLHAYTGREPDGVFDGARVWLSEV